MSNQRRSAFSWFVLATCGVYAGFFIFAIDTTLRYHGLVKDGGWNDRHDARGSYVSTVNERSAAAGRLEPGDRLVAINGDEGRAVLGIFQWRDIDGGKPYRVDFERAGVRRSVELMMPLVRGKQLWPVYQFCGLVFFVCGAALALLRPNDGQVRLTGTALMLVGFSTLHEALQPAYPFLVGWERKVHYAEVPIALWTFPAVYHFFSRFPLWRSPGTIWRAIQWLLYAVLGVVLWPV